MIKWLTLLLFVSGCGFNGEQKLTANDSEQTIVQTGESYTYIIIKLEFLEDIKQLCTDSNIRSEFESEDLYKKAIADCTLDNLSIFNIDFEKASEFADDYCKEGADLSSLTEEEIASVQEACSILGLPVPQTILTGELYE